MKEKIAHTNLVDSEILDSYSIKDFLSVSSVAMFIFNEKGEILVFNKPFKFFFPNICTGDHLNKITKNNDVLFICRLIDKIEKINGPSKEIIPYKNGLTLECSVSLFKSNGKPTLLLGSLSFDFRCDEMFLVQQLVYTLPENIYMKDLEGRFLMANNFLANTMGVKNSSLLIGKTDFDFYPRKYAQKYFEDEQRIIETGIPLINEHEKVISNGRIRWFSTTKFPLFDKYGKLSGIMGISRDISLNIREQRILMKARKEAEKADKLKSAFLANLSHEIRTPLNGILGFTQFLKQKDHSLEKQHKYLDIIQANGNQLLMLINDIIDISMIECNQLRIKYKTFSLNKLLNQQKINFEHQLKQSGSKLKINCSPGLPNGDDGFYCDDLRLTQILNNLVGNAIKFTQEGIIEFGYTAEKKNLTFFVSDTGIGIEAEQQKEIFERFRQADESMTRNYGGTGLGLSICRGLIQILGGDIWVKSKPGEGSIFYFSLPVKNQAEIILKK